MILVGVGANLPTETYGPPLAGCSRALDVLAAWEVRPLKRSRWYRSQPWPPSDQPPFINGVVEVATALSPDALLSVLHDVEATFGRRRHARNAARVLDLDLLSYGGIVTEGADLVLPHPRMHERLFVLAPLADVAPDWRHPRLGLTAREMLERLPPDQVADAIEG